MPVEGSARNVGKPGVGLNPITTGKVSKILGQLENCDSQITPDCLRALYEVVYKQVATEKNSYGIGNVCLRTLNTPILSYVSGGRSRIYNASILG